MIYRTLRGLGVAPAPGRAIQVTRSGVRWNLDLGEGIDFSIYLLGAFERSTAAALRRLAHPGDVVLDIGANVGAHTLHLARTVSDTGHVFAFEATDFAFAKLKQNLALNPELEHRVTATQVILVDDPRAQQPSEIYASWPLETVKDSHPKHLGRLASTSHATMSRLDDLAGSLGIHRVDLIKIDVDGHEYPVLKGASNLITTCSPKIVMELQPYAHVEQGYSFEAFLDLLRSWGYSLSDLDRQKPVPLDAAQLNTIIPDGASMNVIASIA